MNRSWCRRQLELPSSRHLGPAQLIKTILHTDERSVVWTGHRTVDSYAFRDPQLRLEDAGAIRAKDQPWVSHVGMDLIEALAVSELMTQTVKHIANRERPDQSDDTSFPSGHAADTFAFATALERPTPSSTRSAKPESKPSVITVQPPSRLIFARPIDSTVLTRCLSATMKSPREWPSSGTWSRRYRKISPSPRSFRTWQPAFCRSDFGKKSLLTLRDKEHSLAKVISI